MPHIVKLKKSAEKELEHLPARIHDKIINLLLSLKENPYHKEGLLMRLWTIGMICLLMVSYGYSQEKGGQELITVTGQLVKIVAIGGETTGWAVDLDSPLEVNGKKLNRIEIDPNREKIDGFNNKRIKIIGALEKRSGIERKEYWIIMVNKIQEFKTQ